MKNNNTSVSSPPLSVCGESSVGGQDRGLTAAEPGEWSNLNERQRSFLRAIYTVDQAEEENHRGDSRHWSRVPASQWRWLQYDTSLIRSLTSFPSRLTAELRTLRLIDPGTGSTFVALAERGLVQHRSGGELQPAYVRLTRQGRAAVRAALGIVPIKRLPAGTLREWHWRALLLLQSAGEAGLSWDALAEHRIGDGTMRPIDSRGSELTEECGSLMRGDHGWRITDKGRRFVEANGEYYGKLYPAGHHPPTPTTFREPQESQSEEEKDRRATQC